MVFETDLEGAGFQKQVLPEGIHECHWLSTERTAVDLWTEYNDELYAQASTEDTILFLHVVGSAKFPPISYVIRKAQQLQAKYPQQPTTRSAILFQSRFFSGFISTLSKLLNRKEKDTTRVFSIAERDDAIEWLLSGE